MKNPQIVVLKKYIFILFLNIHRWYKTYVLNYIEYKEKNNYIVYIIFSDAINLMMVSIFEYSYLRYNIIVCKAKFVVQTGCISTMWLSLL